ncbi:hypothetical protein [Enterococcus dongliensis]|jgi:hypothetical protein|uniref:hypothetical protein n=1 Tax=Enterococcus dongliensis TaxID=2559925 RepID=UPI002058C582|nr:hypothetical protein [Enterococcus dongliensis]DAG08442.1 MAG TPA: hypothetical protein [Caudoviricetes sp.]MDT2604958.1 hypothetical protein [Enterococcus dongliensis]MDT2613972.1 hypothetical protein [Enterococcus dongliensis]MDT2645618.1 hypothetical protein [Enterococcus dongliensis]MDT2671735.1 hypothetical protein [Enterococcus dongliensis]
MKRETMIKILTKARPDIPKDFWDAWTDDELSLQVGLVKTWMTQHAVDAAFAS